MASLFTSQTPVGDDNSDGTPGITCGTTVQFAQPGTVTAIRFYATTTVGGTYTASLYQVTGADDPGPGTGTLLESKVGGTPTGGTWNTITLDTPVPVTDGVLYRAALHNTDGRYVATNGFFTTPLVNGDITAEADSTDPVGLGTLRQGVFFIDAAPAYPRTPGSQANYFVDVVYTPTPGAESATADIVLPALGAAATATATAVVSAPAVLPALSVTVTGGPEIPAVTDVVLPSLTGAVTGTVATAGTAAVTLPGLLAGVVGSVAAPVGYADPETLLAEWILTATGVKVWADPVLPHNWQFTAAIAHIQRGQSFTPVAVTLDDVTLDVDVYAADADHARRAAAQIQTALEFQLPRTTFPNGIFCMSVSAISRPTWAPDPKVYRRTAAYRIILHGVV